VGAHAAHVGLEAGATKGFKLISLNALELLGRSIH
jgi:hypothetical protein